MKKLILIPITLTALTPTISLCGCTIGGGGDTPEPEPPEGYIVLDQYEYSGGWGYSEIYSDDSMEIDKSTIYNFWIDMRKWEGSRTASDYSDIYFTIDTEPDVDQISKENLEIFIDGETFDISKCWINKPNEINNLLVFDSSVFNKILNSNAIYGQIQTGALQDPYSGVVWFKLHCDLVED